MRAGLDRSVRWSVGHATSVYRGLVFGRLRYPALRLRPSTQRTVDDALLELGFDPVALDSARDDFDVVQAVLLAELADRARAIAGEQLADHLLDRLQAAQENRRLVYYVTRLLRPDVVVETGTFRGTISAFVLQGLADVGAGRLVSLDLPAHKPIRHAVAASLPPGTEPGWIIPERLRDRFELILGDSRKTLPVVLTREQRIDVFIHDSLHTTRHMLFEFGNAWPYLRPGGVLLSDDIFMTPAYWWFTRRKRVPFLHLGNLGVTRKPELEANRR